MLLNESFNPVRLRFNYISGNDRIKMLNCLNALLLQCLELCLLWGGNELI
jgi:hypothetical protein